MAVILMAFQESSSAQNQLALSPDFWGQHSLGRMSLCCTPRHEQHAYNVHSKVEEVRPAQIHAAKIYRNKVTLGGHVSIGTPGFIVGLWGEG
jgi:hypothetical protein